MLPAAPSAILRTSLAIALLFVLSGAAQAASRKHESARHQAARHETTRHETAKLTAEAIENAQWPPAKGKTRSERTSFDPLIVKAEVLLDRAGFSPGEIDGHDGDNFQKALRAFQQSAELEPTGKLDQATWQSLTQSPSEPVMSTYRVTDADVKGPFLEHMPQQYQEMAKLDRLAYRSPSELLAEKFHMSEQLLDTLNKGKNLNEGAEIDIANVAAMPAEGDKAQHKHGQTAEKAARIEVDKRERVVRLFGRDGKLVAFYPASIGSAEKPAPSGKFKVRAVDLNPTYRYDPAYHFKGQTAKEPVTVPSGPNNPVGLVWIDLSAKSYGIHGTPEPQNVSKTQSHGCIRLTNWDALDLAQRVTRGTPVDFVD